MHEPPVLPGGTAMTCLSRCSRTSVGVSPRACTSQRSAATGPGCAAGFSTHTGVPPAFRTYAAVAVRPFGTPTSRPRTSASSGWLGGTPTTSWVVRYGPVRPTRSFHRVSSVSPPTTTSSSRLSRAANSSDSAPTVQSTVAPNSPASSWIRVTSTPAGRPLSSRVHGSRTDSPARRAPARTRPRVPSGSRGMLQPAASEVATSRMQARTAVPPSRVEGREGPRSNDPAWRVALPVPPRGRADGSRTGQPDRPRGGSRDRPRGRQAQWRSRGSPDWRGWAVERSSA